MPDLVFEWDVEKDASNLAKHGIGFADSKMLWQDPYSTTAPCHDWPEDRFMTVATLAEKIWTAIHTYRDGRIRLISVTRSRKGEISSYETDKTQRKAQT